MATYIFKKTLFIKPHALSNGVKAIKPLPNRVACPKGATFEGTLTYAKDVGVEHVLAFSALGYDFMIPYGGTNLLAKTNKNDIVLASQEMPNQSVNSSSNSIDDILQNKSQNENKNDAQPIQNQKSMNDIFKFKDKLHAGITLAGVCFGLFYAYKTKADIKKYIIYTLGAGGLGYFVGNVASGFATTQSLKSKVDTQASAEQAKPLK